MKKDIHPKYQKVLFVDSTSGYRFVCGSTLHPEATEKFEGVDYPVSYLSISSSSHPFFTGSKQLVDAEGRVEKFKKRFGKSTIKEANLEGDSDQPKEHKEHKKEAEHKKAPAAPAKAAHPEKKTAPQADKKAPEKKPAEADKKAVAKKK